MPNVSLDVLREWMHLERQISAVHGVEKIESDRELSLRTGRERLVAEEFARVKEDEIERWQFYAYSRRSLSRILFSSGTQSKHQA